MVSSSVLHVEPVKPATVESPRTGDGVVALFLDYDNLHLSLWEKQRQSTPNASFQSAFPNIDLILGAVGRFGRIATGSAFTDWAKPGLRQAASLLFRHGIEPVFVPGQDVATLAPVKNAADIGMAVAIIDAFYRFPFVDTFVLGTGDGGLLPAVTFLRRHGRHVVVLSVRLALSHALAAAADVVIRYEDLLPSPAPAVPPMRLPSERLGAPSEETVVAWVASILDDLGGSCTLPQVGSVLKRRHDFAVRERLGCGLKDLLGRAHSNGTVVLAHSSGQDLVSLPRLTNPPHLSACRFSGASTA